MLADRAHSRIVECGGVLASTSYEQNQTRDSTYVTVPYEGHAVPWVGRIRSFVRVVAKGRGVDDNGDVCDLVERFALVDYFKSRSVIGGDAHDVSSCTYKCMVHGTVSDTFESEKYATDLETIRSSGSKLAYLKVRKGAAQYVLFQPYHFS